MLDVTCGEWVASKRGLEADSLFCGLGIELRMRQSAIDAKIFLFLVLPVWEDIIDEAFGSVMPILLASEPTQALLWEWDHNISAIVLYTPEDSTPLQSHTFKNLPDTKIKWDIWYFLNLGHNIMLVRSSVHSWRSTGRVWFMNWWVTRSTRI